MQGVVTCEEGRLWGQTPCRRKHLQWVLMDEEGFAEPMRSIPRSWDKPSKDFLWYSEAWSATLCFLLEVSFSFCLSVLCEALPSKEECTALHRTALKTKAKKIAWLTQGLIHSDILQTIPHRGHMKHIHVLHVLILDISLKSLKFLILC